MSPTDEILREMALIRRDLHGDVLDVVDGAAEALDWMAFIQRHPWLTMGAGFALGYLLVPRRARPAVSGAPTRTEPVPEPPPPARPSRWGLLDWAWDLAWPIARHAAQSYAASWIESALLQPQAPRNSSRGPTTATERLILSGHHDGPRGR